MASRLVPQLEGELQLVPLLVHDPAVSLSLAWAKFVHEAPVLVHVVDVFQAQGQGAQGPRGQQGQIQGRILLSHVRKLL